jgi:hypothetical protein
MTTTRAPRRTPEQIAQDRLDTATRLREAGRDRVIRAEAALHAARTAFVDLCRAEAYAAAHPLLQDTTTTVDGE